MEQKERRTIVIGHKNPDTDSICSAIGYANLKRAVTGGRYVPGRAGSVSRETIISEFRSRSSSRMCVPR